MQADCFNVKIIAPVVLGNFRICVLGEKLTALFELLNISDTFADFVLRHVLAFFVLFCHCTHNFILGRGFYH